MKKREYQWCHCSCNEAQANKDFKNYVRLYEIIDGKGYLVDQGLFSKAKEWENKYNATLVLESLYPELD